MAIPFFVYLDAIFSFLPLWVELVLLACIAVAVIVLVLKLIAFIWDVIPLL